MAKFNDKSGHVCEVYSLDNIEKFRKDKNYIEIFESKGPIKSKVKKIDKASELNKEDQESGM